VQKFGPSQCCLHDFTCTPSQKKKKKKVAEYIGCKGLVGLWASPIHAPSIYLKKATTDNQTGWSPMSPARIT
jgi:hypothetical protein